MSNVKTLTTPQTILGTVYDTLVIAPVYQVNSVNGQVRIQVQLTNNANVANGAVKNQQDPVYPVITKQYTVTPSDFTKDVVFAATVTAVGYAVN